MPNDYLPIKGDLNVEHAADRCVAALAAVGVRPIARVWETARALDIAVITGGARKLVLRCVEQPSNADYAALATMISAGDFDRAALVHLGTEPHLSPDEVAIWPIEELQKVVQWAIAP